MKTLEHFGAIGDGIADDTIAWHKALLAAKNIEASKTYYIPDGITLSSGVIIDGKGSGKIITNGVKAQAIFAKDSENIAIKGLSTEIPLTNGRKGFKINIQMNRCKNVSITDCSTYGGVAGMWFVSCENVNVKDSLVDTPKADGIHFGQGSRFCTADSNTIINAGDDSLATTYYKDYTMGRPHSNKFINNTVIDSVWGRGVAIYSGDNMEIRGNKIEGTGLGGVSIVSHQEAPDCNNIIVDGNTFTDTNSAKVIPYMYWDGTPDKPITSLLHKSTLPIKGSNITVSNNTFIRTTGIRVESGEDIKLHNNVFSKTRGEDITVAKGVKVSIIKPEKKKSVKPIDRLLRFLLRLLNKIKD